MNTKEGQISILTEVGNSETLKIFKLQMKEIPSKLSMAIQVNWITLKRNDSFFICFQLNNSLFLIQAAHTFTFYVMFKR